MDPALEFSASIQPASRHLRVNQLGEQTDHSQVPIVACCADLQAGTLTAKLDMYGQVHSLHKGSKDLSSRGSAASPRGAEVR